MSVGSLGSERPPVATKWYFQEFEVREIRVNLTYRHGEHVLSDAFSKGSPMIMLMQNLDRMPLVLHRFPITHRFEAPQQIGGQIAMSYKRELLKQVYKILLHIDLLGNPLSLTRGLAAGFKDFLTMPAEGLLAADAEMFVRGLGKGTWSLAKGVIGQGVFKTGAQVSSALSRTIATFSFDSKYVRDREMQNAHHHKPTHIGQGLLSGAWALASGVGDGVAGLFTAPLEGAREQGLGGMLKGFGRGAAGLVVKPLAGAVDLASRTMEGGANTFDLAWLRSLNEDDLDFTTGRSGGEGEGDSRLRPPRMMHGPERATRPYSRSEAIAHRVLGKVRDGFYCTEALLLCVALSRDELIVRTENRLLVAGASSFKTSQHYTLSSLQRVQLRADGKAIELWLKQGGRNMKRGGNAKQVTKTAFRWATSKWKHLPVSSSTADEMASSTLSASSMLSSWTTTPHMDRASHTGDDHRRSRHGRDDYDDDDDDHHGVDTMRDSEIGREDSSVVWDVRTSSHGPMLSSSRHSTRNPPMLKDGGSKLVVIACNDVQNCRYILSKIVEALTSTWEAGAASAAGAAGAAGAARRRRHGAFGRGGGTAGRRRPDGECARGRAAHTRPDVPGQGVPYVGHAGTPCGAPALGQQPTSTAGGHQFQSFCVDAPRRRARRAAKSRVGGGRRRLDGPAVATGACRLVGAAAHGGTCTVGAARTAHHRSAEACVGLGAERNRHGQAHVRQRHRQHTTPPTSPLGERRGTGDRLASAACRHYQRVRARAVPCRRHGAIATHDRKPTEQRGPVRDCAPRE